MKAARNVGRKIRDGHSPLFWLRALLLSVTVGVPLIWSVWIALAATRTWTGASIGDPNPANRNNLWTNAENWSGNVAPSAHDDLTFGGAVQVVSTNNFLSFTNFNSISITSIHTMQGNSIGLDSGITANIGNIQLSSIKLNNSQTFNATTTGAGPVITSAVDTNGKTLTLDGPGNFNISGVISGSGSLIKMGAGTTSLSGNNSYTATTISHGTLLVFGDQHSSAVNVDLGVLGGTGTVGTTTAGAFSRISPGAANGTGVLTVNGNLSYPVGSVPANFNIDLNGVTVGTGYDQLVATGGVSFNSHPTLNISLSFSPSAGTSFTIIKNDSANPTNGEFANRPEGSVFTVNGITFAITYKGGNGNDIVLHVPTDRTWDGGGADNKWTTAANWDNDIAPMVGDRLIFPTSPKPSSMNDFPDGTVFTSISATSGHVIQGNSIGLGSGGIRIANAA